ncbi:type II toxin-antitoxin system HicB family antitoxin [Ignicoccus hospitalis]|uniref:HicB-like antitoxin of toxin-antitoxin system domain-containing protein n=1 Tax=Ignicoccus hospitalis (strain KIN4/I / DSM 18386 / JCM 14125) TaxID=453591 RepID=A8ABJ3_IGNH4|nr:hypothetical protein [Ignicoccus hospitalis]ABU82295.1 hypothetical protein Igni_1118 [Ignicoccus hospitalis KIN4/I]HIH90785.1 hypothetical protein [Desulfurococcaceae archaeon]
MAKVKVGVVIYKEKDESGEYYIAVEPLSGAQVQGDSVEEVLEKIKDEIKKMSSAWCESELREAVDARLIELELEEAAAE